MPFWDRNTSNGRMKGQRQRKFFKGEHFITKRQIQHLEVVTNLVRICLAMPMSTFIYECRPVDVHVPCFVCMSMSVSFSVSMTACPHLHFVRPGWWGIAGAPVGKNSVHKFRNAGCSKQWTLMRVPVPVMLMPMSKHTLHPHTAALCLFPHARVRI